MHRRLNEAFYLGCVQDQFEAGDGCEIFWGCLIYYKLSPFNAVTTDRSHHILANIRDDKVLPLRQHLQHGYTADPSFLTITALKFIGLEEYATGVISTHTAHYISIGLKHHLKLPHRKSIGHVGLVGNTPKSVSPEFFGVCAIKIPGDWLELDAAYLETSGIRGVTRY